jgi:hypothetical protein
VIVSNIEITRVISLARGMPLAVVAMAAECAAPVLPPVSRSSLTLGPAAGQDREFRHTRVRDLQQMLAEGGYAVPPDQVAGKMIGRAICDQVSRLFDA